MGTERLTTPGECEVCRQLSPVEGFGGYRHYASTKKVLEGLVRDGAFERTISNPWEICYQCKGCNTVWLLAEPDFPVTGYLLRN